MNQGTRIRIPARDSQDEWTHIQSRNVSCNLAIAWRSPESYSVSPESLLLALELDPEDHPRVPGQCR